MNKNQIYSRHGDCSNPSSGRIDMRIKFNPLVLLLIFIADCSGGNPHVVQKKGKEGPTVPTTVSQSQPAVLRVETRLTAPKTEGISAKMYFYSPSATGDPEESKMLLKQFVENENSLTYLNVIVRGDSDSDQAQVKLYKIDSQTLNGNLNVQHDRWFQNYTVSIDSFDNLQGDFLPDSSLSVPLPKPVFALKKDYSARI